MSFARTLTTAVVVSLAVGTAAGYAASTVTVGQKGKRFSETEVVINVGDRVDFLNDDKVKHNIQIKGPGMKFNGRMQAPGKMISVSFDKAGKFKARCGLHPKMKMTVKVNG